MFKNLVGVCVGLAVLGMAKSVDAVPIIYNVDRIIGDGTVTGFVETDGTIGVLSAANILDFSISIYAPDLVSPSIADSLTLIGDGLSATASQLLFDFSGAGNLLLIQRINSPRYASWCVMTLGWGCSVVSGPAEAIVGAPPVVPQSVVYSGQISIANTSAVVPEPSALVLVATGLAGLGIGRRRRKRVQSASR